MLALALTLLVSAPPTEGSTQAVVVTTASWTSTLGRLQRYEKKEGAWVAVGGAVDVVVGEAGVGWGVGLHEFAAGPGEPKKMEGDGRAPAGVFALTRVLGKDGVPQTAMPHQTIQPTDVCVDDSRSSAYNRVFSSDDVTLRPAFESSEKLLRRDAVYDLLVVVDHNHVDAKEPLTAVKGRGSCVFLHVWKRKNAATIGCTAMAHAALIDVVAWLEPTKQPVLIQLPRDIYMRVREPWQLP